MRKFLQRHRNGGFPGFVLVEHLGALLALLLLLPILVSIWDKGVTELRKRSVAAHFSAITRAAELYAQQQHSTLFAASTENTGVVVPLATLRSSGALSDAVPDKNAWGQNYQIVSRKIDGNLAMVVLTTGGRGHTEQQPDFANVTVPETAALAKAGFIPTNLLASNAYLRGAYGAWQIVLADLGLSGTAGHLGIVSSLDSSTLGQDYLYRVEVPGHPELNQMQTTLDMSDHAITGVKEIQYIPHTYAEMGGDTFCADADDEGRTFLDSSTGLYLCRDGRITLIGDTGNSTPMQDARVVTNLSLIEKPVCASGTNTHPEIFVAPSIADASVAGEEAPPMSAIQAWATNFSDTEWQVRMRILTSDNTWLYPGDNYGRLVVMTTCAKD